MVYGKTIQQREAERAASAEANKKLHDEKVARQSAFVNAFTKEMDNRDREAEIKAEEKAEAEQSVIDNMESIVDDLIKDIQANGVPASGSAVYDKRGNITLGEENKLEQTMRILVAKKQSLEGQIYMTKDKARSDELIEQYKAVDIQIAKLKKAVKRAY